MKVVAVCRSDIGTVASVGIEEGQGCLQLLLVQFDDMMVCLVGIEYRHSDC